MLPEGYGSGTPKQRQTAVRVLTIVTDLLSDNRVAWSFGLPKNEIALLSPEDVSSAISESYEPPRRFVRWQPNFVKPSCRFVSRKAIGGRCFPVGTRFASVNLAPLAGHEICF